MCIRDSPKSITSFDKLESDSLSKQQLEKANKEYKIVDGQFTKIKKDEK